MKYVLTFAKDEDGNDLKFRFICSLNKKLDEILLKAVNYVEGIDRVEVVGRYSFEVIICRAFEEDAVIEDLKKKLDEFTSEIIVAKPGLRLVD